MDYQEDISYKLVIGKWFLNKYAKQMQEKGVLRVAKNLRKQGVPIEITLLVVKYYHLK